MSYTVLHLLLNNDVFVPRWGHGEHGRGGGGAPADGALLPENPQGGGTPADGALLPEEPRCRVAPGPRFAAPLPTQGHLP